MSRIRLFPQIARLIDAQIVKNAEKKFRSSKNTQYLDTRTHLYALLFCQLGDCQSLRDICNAMKCIEPNLKELGISKTPSRNALSNQNRKRNPQVFREIYMQLRQKLGQQPLGIKRVAGINSRRVVLLDSSVVTLCMELFRWAHYKEEKGAIKMHTLFSMRDFLPIDIHVSDGKESDNDGAIHLLPKHRSIIVADRGYDDTELWRNWDSNGITFVVRLRKDLQFKKIGEFEQPDGKEEQILIDEAVELTGEKTSQNYPNCLRRVVVYHPYNTTRRKPNASEETSEEKEDVIELITNNAFLSAEQISELYKSRWQIETFFKTIKQYLRIKSFIGTNKNAVLSQIWSAMIALLLLRYLKLQATYDWHMSNLVGFIRLALFSTINLSKWLNNPLCLEEQSAEKVDTGGP